MPSIIPVRSVADAHATLLAALALIRAYCAKVQHPLPSRPSINTGTEVGRNVEGVRVTKTEQSGVILAPVPCEPSEESMRAPRRLMARIEGQVTDGSGRGIPDATVVMTNEKTKRVAWSDTDEVVKYSAPVLRPGSNPMDPSRNTKSRLAPRSAVSDAPSITPSTFGLPPDHFQSLKSVAWVPFSAYLVLFLTDWSGQRVQTISEGEPDSSPALENGIRSLLAACCAMRCYRHGTGAAA